MRFFNLATILITLVAAGCGPWLPELEPSFVSKCGAKVFGTTDQSGYDRAEDAALEAIQSVYGWDAVYTCILLQGREVQVLRAGEKGPGYFQNSGRTVSGVAYCARGVLLANDDWEHNALAHELVHLFDNCKVRMEMQCAVKNIECNHLRDHPEMDKFDAVDNLYWQITRSAESGTNVE